MTPGSVPIVTPPAAEAPSASDPTTAAGIASTHKPISASTTIKSLADLQRKAPQVYKMMMMSIQEMVRRDMQHHQDRLKKANRGET